MRILAKLSLAGMIASLSGTATLGQITFKDAYPGVKFSRPIYFGPFPGKAKANVVLEEHTGLALVISPNGSSWAKDTLFKISVNQSDEMGLLGIAFHPEFNANRKFYVSYCPSGTSMFNIVEERTADSTGLKESKAIAPRTLFKIADKYTNHNGGTLAFGPKDGFLYFGTGDGGSQNDPDGNGQNTNSLLGKILRIDVNKKDSGLEYGIPTDNPFAKGGGRGEIFAYGLRNPWKWSFDPLNGDLWAGDVGQNAIEEVDLITLGGNYGWKTMEGPNGTNNGNMILPVYSYARAQGTCVIGGAVFRGNSASKYYGTYFTADHNTKKMWALKKNGTGLATVENLPNTPSNFSTFGTDAEGRIYAAGLENGILYSLESPDLTPTVSNRLRTHSLLGRYRRSYTVSPGERLDAAAFARDPVLDLFTTNGIRLAELTRETPRLPDRIESGVYLLRPAGDAAPDLLVVR